MRALALAVLVGLVGCGGGGDDTSGDDADDDASAGVPDASPAGLCAPTGACETGPACGDGCCRTGESCVDGECRCGDAPACGVGDTCEAAGPIGGDQCGSICCGISGPCPQ